MGLAYADIEITIAQGIAMASRDIIGEEEIRKMPITFLGI